MATPIDKTTKEVDKRTSEVGKEVVKLENFLDKYGEYQLKSIANAGLQDSDSRTFIVDVSNLLSSVYDNLKSGFSEKELKEYTDMVSTISSKYTDNPEVPEHMSKWRQSRKELIEITKSAAENLDQNFAFVNIARICGSLVEILNSLNLDIYQQLCSSIASYAYNISPKLGLIAESALKLVPHLRFMGFASSFFEIMVSQVVINRVVKAMKKDKDMFRPLKEWFDETNEFGDSIKKLLPYGIDKEIIESIEKALKDLGEEEKIFSAAVLSSIKEDPMSYKDGKFLAKVFLFCRSDASKEWYRRMLTGDRPSELECAMLYFCTELHQLEGTDVDSGSKIEIAKCSAKQLENTAQNSPRSILGRLILCGMSGMSVYYCLENMRAGSKHRYSDKLRELSTNAQSFLNTMERIRI